MPFYPQEPVPPELFGNRQAELNDLKGILTSALETGRIENAVICGGRGSGKTSMFVKLIDECPAGCFISFRALSSRETLTEFAENTIEKMDVEYKEQLPKHEKYLRSVTDKIEEISVAQFSVAIRRQELTPQNGLLQTIMKFRDRKFKAVVLCVDEADLLSNETLAVLKNVFEEARARYSYPAAVFLAGKEDVTKRLTGEWSPIRRFYAGHIHELGPFNLEGVRDTLTKAGLKDSFTWTPAAVKWVYDETEGHPFFVQILGKMIEKHSPSRNIDVKDVEGIKQYALKEVWDWYEQSWTSHPSPKEKEVVLQLAKLGGRSSYSTLNSSLGISSLGVHLRRLLRKKIIIQDKTSDEYYLPTRLIVEAILAGFLERKA